METVTQIQQVLVERLHGTLMGPVVESQEYDERTGKQYRVFTWEVANGTYVEKDLPHGWRVDIAPNNFNKSKLTLWISRKRKADDTYEDGYPTEQTKTVGEVDLTPQMFKRFLTTKETVNRKDLAKETVSELPAVPTLSDDQTQIQHIKVDDHNYDERVVEEVLDESAGPLLGQQTGTWGVEGTSKKLVVDGVTTPSGFGVKQSQVTPIGNGKSVEAVETYPADGDADGIIYTLEEEKTDEKLGIVVEIEKSLINAANKDAITAASRSAGWYPEVQAIDKWHSIMIAAKVDLTALPADQVWIEAGRFSMPNELLEVGVIWDSDIFSDAGASGTDDNTYIEDNDVRWNVAAEVTINGHATGRPYTKIKAGRSGTAQVEVTRSFHNGPPSDAITPHEFEPVYGQLLIHGQNGVMIARGTQDGIGANRITNGQYFRKHIDTKSVVHDFGPVIYSGTPTITEIGTDTQTRSLNAWATTGTLPGTGTFPATSITLAVGAKIDLILPASGTPPSSGAKYIQRVVTRDWGFGVWIREIYRIIVP